MQNKQLRLDFLVPTQSRNDVLNFFLNDVEACFKKNGCHCLQVLAQKDKPELFIDTLINDKPDCTFSFNGVRPNEEGVFLSEALNIPHIACLVDSPCHFIELATAKNYLITCSDRQYVDFFHSINASHVHFMPMGASIDLVTDPSSPRTYDVVMLGSCSDPRKMAARWKDRYSPQHVKIIQVAIEIFLSGLGKSILESLMESVHDQVHQPEGIRPRDVDYRRCWWEIELYLRAFDRIELLKALSFTSVHVFGSGDETWKEVLPYESGHIILHDPLPFNQGMEILKKSKIVLNSSPHMIYGANERVFTSAAAGALNIATYSTYLNETFHEGEALYYYLPGRWKGVEDKIQTCLRDEDLRNKMAKKAQEIVIKQHTWDHRIHEFLPVIKEFLISNNLKFN